MNANCRIKSLFVAGLLLLFAVSGLAAGAAAQTGTLPGPTGEAKIPGVAQQTNSQSPIDTARVPSVASSTLADESYRLGTGDKLRVNVYDELDLSGEFLVDASGQVQMPLIGQVQAAGLTIHEFVAEVSSKLMNGYLKDPKISVEVENYRPFYIMGEVNKPGEYPFENGINVLGAVALAGGYTYRAQDSQVYVRRSGSSSEQVLPADASTKVFPGDIVRVAERIF
jgi:protein involved in polysaccharide export with SLBB domain